MLQMTALLAVLTVMVWLFGASVFSFLNVVIYRLPRGKSFVKGFSYCPDCGHRLYGLDMVPVFSWFFLRGRCRYCKEPVSFRYTVVELLGGCIALLCVFKIGLNPAALTVFAFLGVLTVAAFVDIDTMEIPDGVVLAALLAGVISVFTRTEPGLISRVLGIFCVSVPMLLVAVAVPGGFGGGDIKLMAACGVLLGVKLSLCSMLIAVFTGGIYGIWLLASGKKGRKEQFAFGPFLCAGMAVSVFWGNALIDGYLRFCGLR